MNKTLVHMREIPYFSQWESPELVSDIINRKIKTYEDQNWRNSGAISTEEYEYWSWNICGMACLKMVLTHIFDGQYKTIDLAKDCMKYGAYKHSTLKDIGLHYKPFCKYIQDTFGLEATFFGKDLTLKQVAHETNLGNFFIVSVSREIKDISCENPKKKGGHLVLVTNYDFIRDVFFIHNPSGYSNKSQVNYPVPSKDLIKFFAGRGIFIRKP